MLSMLTDHISYCFFPTAYFMEFIGEIAYPLYAFMLVQGYVHTKSDYKRLARYGTRLLICGIVSEVFFDLCFYNSIFYFGHQNVLFELLIGLSSLWLYDWLKEKNKDGFISILLAVVLSVLLNTDHQATGIIIIYIFFFANNFINKPVELRRSGIKNRPRAMILSVFGLFVLITISNIILTSSQITMADIYRNFTDNGGWARLGLLIAPILVFFYNGKQGPKNKFLQIFFYSFYPIHIAILYIINTLLHA